MAASFTFGDLADKFGAGEWLLNTHAGQIVLTLGVVPAFVDHHPLNNRVLPLRMAVHHKPGECATFDLLTLEDPAVDGCRLGPALTNGRHATFSSGLRIAFRSALTAVGDSDVALDVLSGREGNLNLVRYPPLDQTYRVKKTLAAWPSVRERFERLEAHARATDFVRANGTCRGRLFDYAVLLETAGNLAGKSVAEFGGRDGMFAPFVTDVAASVHVSDYFEEWGKGTDACLGQFGEWDSIWKKTSFRPEVLHTGAEDLMKLSMPDDQFDVTACVSVIEHLWPQHPDGGDVQAMREMIRVTKNGGLLLISTDMLDPRDLEKLPDSAIKVGEHSAWHSGTLWYHKDDLMQRLVETERTELVHAVCDFDVTHPDNDHVGPLPNTHPEHGPRTTAVVFALRVKK